MKIFEAVVTSNIDFGHSGRLYVSSTAFPGVERTVRYTTPYAGLYSPTDGQKSGFFGIPAIGQQILIAEAENADDLYYLASIVKTESRTDETTLKSMNDSKAVPKEVYQDLAGAPQKIVLRDCYGNKLVLSHSYKNYLNRENNSIYMESSKGKTIALIDSPQFNRIKIENEYRDGFYLQSKAPMPGKDFGDREMTLRTGGIGNFYAKQALNFLVSEGKEFNLRNESTTVNSGSEDQRSGNVNISSKHKDINLTSEGEVGRIMIRAKGSEGLIQIKADGTIIIKAPSDNVFIEGDNINIKASSDLNMEAGGNINIKAGGQAIMSGSNATVSLSEDAVIDGTFVQLAPPGGVSPAAGADSSEDIVNNYGD